MKNLLIISIILLGLLMTSQLQAQTRIGSDFNLLYSKGITMDSATEKQVNFSIAPKLRIDIGEKFSIGLSLLYVKEKFNSTPLNPGMTIGLFGSLQINEPYESTSYKYGANVFGDYKVLQVKQIMKLLLRGSIGGLLYKDFIPINVRSLFDHLNKDRGELDVISGLPFEPTEDDVVTGIPADVIIGLPFDRDLGDENNVIVQGLPKENNYVLTSSIRPVILFDLTSSFGLSFCPGSLSYHYHLKHKSARRTNPKLDFKDWYLGFYIRL